MFYSVVFGNCIAALFSIYSILFQIIRSPHKHQRIYQIALVTTTLNIASNISTYCAFILLLNLSLLFTQRRVLLCSY